jgi:hypothetical protein
MPRTPPRKGGVIAFGCSRHLFRLERASSLSPGCRREPHRRQAKPRGSHANRLSPFRSFHRVAQTRPSPLPIVGAVPSWSRLPGWAPRRRIGPHEFCSFTPCRIFGLSTSTVETTAPPVDVSSPPRHAHYGRKRTIRGRWKNIVGDNFWEFLVLCWMLACRIPIAAGAMPNSGNGSLRRTCRDARDPVFSAGWLTPWGRRDKGNWASTSAIGWQ